MQETGQSLTQAARNAPYLARDEEYQLAQHWKQDGDLYSLHRITTAHMRLVLAMASRFRHYGLSMSDLVQEGHVGLLEAAARFDPEREVRFSTYATWWIRASMQDYILRNWSIVRSGTSSAQKSLFFNLRRLRIKLQKNDNFRVSDELYQELAAALGVSVKDVVQMDMRMSGYDTSLNAPLNTEDETGAERMDFLLSDAPSPEEIVTDSIDGKRRSDWLNQALETLNGRELAILKRRRLSEDGATLESLGTSFGISKERVRQIETRALEKLKTALIKDHPEVAAYAG